MGGKGGQVPARQPIVLTDPVTGRTFVDTPQEQDFGSLFGTMPGYKSAEQRLNEFIAQRESDAKAKKEADKAAADAKAASDLTAWQGKRDKLIGDERNAFTSYFQQQGLDPTQYQSDIDAAINQRTNTLANNSDLTGLFSASMPQDLVNTLTANRQTKNLSEFNRVFDPSYATSHVSDTLDDTAINDILGKQFDPLRQGIDLAFKRGQLDQRGVTGATKELENELSSARSQVSSLGNDILSGYRGKLNDVIGAGRTSASTVPLGSTFSIDPYTKQVTDLISGFGSNIGSDLAAKVGNNQYGDITKILNAGGAYQGPIAAAASTAPAVDIAGDILDPSRKRTLQTAGAF